MGNRTPDWPEYPAWSTARYFQFLRSALRGAWGRWPAKFQLLKENRRTVTGRRHKFEYMCAQCKGWFQQKEIQVDHIIPAGALNCHEDLKGFVARLFVGVDKLQIMCKPCHKVKTKEERDAM